MDLSFRDLNLLPKMSLPSKISGIVVDWTSVGAEKFCCATAWRSRESRPRVLKLDGFWGTCVVITAVGTSCSSSLRFMIAFDCYTRQLDCVHILKDYRLL